MPARAAATPCSGCSPDGVAIVTTSAFDSASIFSYDVKCGTFHSSPARAARSGSASHTAASSRPSILAMASKWFLLMRPQPEKAILKFWGVKSGLSHQQILLELVAGSANRAALRILVGEPLTALAHPPQLTGRNTDHQSIGRHVARNDSSRTDERVFTERNSAHDGGVRADRRTAPHPGCLVLVLARDVTARVDDVGKHHRRSAKHVILELDALVYRNVVLDLHIRADLHAIHHDHILAERASLTDDGTAEDVAEMPDLGVVTDSRAIVDICRLVNERLGHLDAGFLRESRVPLLERQHRWRSRAQR